MTTLIAVATGLMGIFAAGLWLLTIPATTRERARATPPQWGRLEDSLAQAGWSTLSAPTTLMLWCGLSAVVALMVWLVVPIPVLAPLAFAAMLISGHSILRSAMSARQRRLRQAWPGVIDHLRQAVRSGAGVSEAVIVASHRVPDEVRPAFQSFQKNLESGFRIDQALFSLKQSLAHPISDRIIEALRMAHDVGGRELPAVLESLQSSVRSDISVREEAYSKQSWIRAASKLGVAAPWIVLVVISGRPETVSAYSSWTGSAVLLAGAGLSVVAYKMMATLGRLPEDRRWFAG